MLILMPSITKNSLYSKNAPYRELSHKVTSPLHTGLIIAFSCLFTCLVATCFGVSNVNPTEHDQPWFTGPLLTPSARVILPGHINLEPYLFCNIKTGNYGNKWKAISTPTYNQLNPQLQIKLGIYNRIDLSSTIQSFINVSQGKSGSSFGDLPIGIEYQLYQGEPHDWLNYAKLSIQEVLPTGKYRKLNPRLLNTDVGGQGSFITNIGLTFSKLTKLADNHFLGCRCNISTALSCPAKLKGYNIYGGSRETRGKIYPGTSYSFLAGVEYTLTKEFSLACDFQAQYAPRGRFKGFTLVPVRDPKSLQFSLAPAFEYNWSSSMGIIVGSWFSLAGRNSSRFISGVAAFNYSY
jgi:hypothetical protein